MPIQVMADDSGGPGQGPVQVMAGLIGRAEDWALFSDRWDNCLQESPRVEVFKMRDAATCDGYFRGFSREWRDEKVRKLATIINDFGFQIIHVTLEMPAFESTIRQHARGNPLTKPYFYAFSILILAACYELLDRGETERFEMFFDEHLSLGPKVKLWYPITYAAVEPACQAILPIEPSFKDDADFKPLQAADMMAWLCRRDTSGEPHSFGWLKSVLSRVGVSSHSQYLDYERMKGIVEISRTSETPTAEQVAEARTLLGY